MTPHQISSTACANFKPEGCMGIGIGDNGSLFRLWPKEPSCRLLVPGQRCIYFETCIVAGIRTMAQGPKRDSWLRGIGLYLRRLADLPQRLTAKRNIYGQAPDDTDTQASRLCTECKNPVAGIARYCPSCAKARANKSKRESKAKKQVGTGIANQ